MFDNDLAELYGVNTSYLNKAVSRNKNRFPEDFMFELSQKEFDQIKKEGKKHGGRRKLPKVFTENGIAMLSGVLHSERAVEVNISIMRIFTKLRKLLLSDESLSDRIGKLEKGTDRLFRIVFERLNHLEAEMPILPAKRKKIGFDKKN